MEVVSNKMGRSLMIQSIVDDENKLRRRVYIPEGFSGAGWKFFSRELKKLCKRKPRIPENLSVETPIQAPISLNTSGQRWLSFKTSKLFDLGGWENMVVCTINRQYVDWVKVGIRLAVVLKAEEDFIFSPFF